MTKPGVPARGSAAMEPGHEGREEEFLPDFEARLVLPPQWSPAMKAGKRYANSNG